MTDQAKYIWFNGKVINWNDAQVHVMSHALHYGTSVFEGIKCYKTKDGPIIFRLKDHIDRLFESANKYKIEIPFEKSDLYFACIDVVNKNKLENCYIRPVVFYGYDTLGVHPKNCPVSVAIASFYWGAYLGDSGLTNGVRVKISPIKKYSNDSFISTAKASGQYLNSLLAVQDARSDGFDEAILTNHENNVSEGSGQNIFFVKNNIIYTNDEDSCILMGITRESILTIAEKLKIPFKIIKFKTTDLLNADEVFFTGTATEVTPVIEIDRHTVSDGRPGKLTEMLREYYLNIVKGENLLYNNWLTKINTVNS